MSSTVSNNFVADFADSAVIFDGQSRRFSCGSLAISADTPIGISFMVSSQTKGTYRELTRRSWVEPQRVVLKLEADAIESKQKFAFQI